MASDPEHSQTDGNQDSTSGDALITTSQPDARRRVTQDDFLVPGPTPESNEGLGRWGLSWLIFSIVVMGLMLLISFLCLMLATWTGVA